MLELDAVDLGDLCDALEDHSYDTSWWLDPRTGAVRYHNADLDDETTDDLVAGGHIYIEPLESRDAYRDMEAFIARVSDRRAADLLDRAIQGRGAFRRFKDTLFEFPALRERWFEFHDARMRRRAILWLGDHELISPEIAERAAAEHPDPVVGGGVVDLDELVRDVARDLATLYAERLEQVLVFGSWAPGEAEDDSDLDLLVVLSDLANPWEELRRMDDMLWRHSERGGVTVSAFPVSGAEFDRPTTPMLIQAKAEATPVG